MLFAHMSVRDQVVAALDEGIVGTSDLVGLIGAPRAQVAKCLSKLARDGAIDHDRCIIDRSIAERAPGRPRAQSTQGSDAAALTAAVSLVVMCIDRATQELTLIRQAAAIDDAGEMARRLAVAKAWLDQGTNCLGSA